MHITKLITACRSIVRRDVKYYMKAPVRLTYLADPTFQAVCFFDSNFHLCNPTSRSSRLFFLVLLTTSALCQTGLHLVPDKQTDHSPEEKESSTMPYIYFFFQFCLPHNDKENSREQDYHSTRLSG